MVERSEIDVDQAAKIEDSRQNVQIKTGTSASQRIKYAATQKDMACVTFNQHIQH